jgi:hypothetical protein
MPDNPTLDDDDEEPDHPTAAPAVAHDDIMKRLLDYQRQMREGEEPEAHVPFDEPARAPATDLAGDLPEGLPEARDEPAEVPTFEPPEPPAAEGAEGLAHWSDEETVLDDPIAAREAETREPVLEGGAEAGAIPESREEPQPSARRGFFRSRGSRREAADVPSLEEATNLADVPDFDDLAPAPAFTGSVAAELEARLAGFERTLQRLHTQVGELRQTFADLAIAADERLGALEDAIAKARTERFS